TGIRSIEQDDINGICALYPSGTTSGSTSSSASTGGGMDCNTCINNSINQGGACAAQGQACFSSQDCVNLVNCSNACQSEACLQGCANQHPNGVTGYNGMLQCALGACSVECNQGSG